LPLVASDTGRYETCRLLDEHAEALRRALETARVAAIASEESALTELSRQCASEQAPVRPRPSMHVLTTAASLPHRCASEQAEALYELRASLEHATTALVATETRAVREAARDEAAKELERTVRAALVTTRVASSSAFECL
jgi:hypothetical protein